MIMVHLKLYSTRLLKQSPCRYVPLLRHTMMTTNQSVFGRILIPCLQFIYMIALGYTHSILAAQRYGIFVRNKTMSLATLR
jgi:hypothetical protein